MADETCPKCNMPKKTGRHSQEMGLPTLKTGRSIAAEAVPRI